MDTILANEDIPPEEKVLALLPGKTVAAIDLDDDLAIAPSVQTLAYRWMKDDPHLFDYPSWRLIQRFALALLIFVGFGFSPNASLIPTLFLAFDMPDQDGPVLA